MPCVLMLFRSYSLFKKKKIICTQVLRIVTEDENSEAGEESQEQDGAKTGVKVVALQCQNTPTYIIIIKN